MRIDWAFLLKESQLSLTFWLASPSILIAHAQSHGIKLAGMLGMLIDIPPPLFGLKLSLPWSPTSETVVLAEAVGYPKVSVEFSGHCKRMAYIILSEPSTREVYLPKNHLKYQ